MKIVKKVLPLFAFVFAIIAAFAFDTNEKTLVQQVSKKINGVCQGPVSMPESCSFAGDNLCEAGVYYKYESTTGLSCSNELRRP